MEIRAIVGYIAPKKNATYTNRNGERVTSPVTNLKAYIHGVPANKKYDTVFLDFGLWNDKASQGQNLHPGDAIIVACDKFCSEKVEIINELTGEVSHGLKVKPAFKTTISVLDGTKYVALSEYKASAKAAPAAKAVSEPAARF